MSIHELWEKIKVYLEKDEVIHGCMVFTVILVGLAGFGLGKFSRVDELPVRIEYKNLDLFSENDLSHPDQNKTIIASKNGTKYYFSNCRGVGNIKEENRIVFTSESDAVAAGYSKAVGCNK